MSNREQRIPLERKFLLELVGGHPIVAAVSGGADSMALLHFLAESGIQTVAAHFNHQLRGAESDRDEAFVRDFCQSREIPFFVGRADIREIAGREKLGEEECSRQERYRFLESVRQKLGEDALIATAHTLSDQLETMLFRLARGTGLAGLCGIPEQRGRIVRPMLRCSRADVEDYCVRHSLSYVTDSTNADTHYARNRIRLEAVPALKEINSAVEIHAGRLAAQLAADRDYLELQAAKLFAEAKCEDGLCAQPLREAHPSLRVRALARFLEEEQFSAEDLLLERIQGLLFEKNTAVNLPGGCRMVWEAGVLRIVRPLPPFNFQISLPDFVEEKQILREFLLPDGKSVRLVAVSRENFEKNRKIYNSDLISLLDYDTINGRLQMRYPIAGDRIHLKPGMPAKLLKKIYSEQKLPLSKRQCAAAAADESGLVWAQFAGTSVRNKPFPQTKRLLMLMKTAEKEFDSHDEK